MNKLRTVGNVEHEVRFTIRTSDNIELPSSFARDALFQAIGKEAWEKGILIEVGDLEFVNEAENDGE